jgi:hypothetical protein
MWSRDPYRQTDLLTLMYDCTATTTTTTTNNNNSNKIIITTRDFYGWPATIYVSGHHHTHPHTQHFRTLPAHHTPLSLLICPPRGRILSCVHYYLLLLLFPSSIPTVLNFKTVYYNKSPIINNSTKLNSGHLPPPVSCKTPFPQG